jgi:putative N6-adenine-specific DNA methylase
MKHTLFINCFPRLVPWLEQEVKALGFDVTATDRMGLYVEGSYHDTYVLNYCLRTASKVLFQLAEFSADTPDQLYRELSEIPWEDYIPGNGYFSVGGFVKNDNIRDNRFAFMKAKDAIVDRIQKRTGLRPDSGPKTDKTVLFLRWHKDEVTISIDTSGETLSKHGYRKMPGKAPMMEALAAAVVMATRWDMHSPFINPMCGAGTLAIEAALMLQNTYPGQFREEYGFMHTQLYDEKVWKKEREGLSSRKKSGSFPVIIATDHDPEAIKAAKENARAAGVEFMIDFKECDFRDTPIVPDKQGIVILNPEYGERMGEEEELRETYKEIGDFFKKECHGYTGYIFTGNMDLAKSVGLRASRRLEFFNARIDSRLLEYELYSGTRRPKSEES